MAGIDTYTKLMLHCNGADASTTFTDSSDSPHTVTANGNAQIDTAQSKFGGASGLFDGTGDYLSVPEHTDWALRPTTGDEYTIDFWVRFNSVASNQNMMGQSAGGGGFWAITWDQGSNKLYIYEFHGVTQGIFTECSWTPSVNTWYHIAFVASSGSGRFIFIDGVSQTLTTDIDALITYLSSPLYIGYYGLGNTLNGWLDEIRISKGVARWTSNFTPPTSEYTSSFFKIFLNQRYALSGVVLNKETLNQRWALEVPTGPHLLSLNLRWALEVPTGPHLLSLNQRYIFNGYHIPVTVYHAITYTLTLTGAPDSLPDIILPMSSFQSRLKDGDPSWLSAVVPNGLQYSDSVEARPNGELVVDRNGIKEDGTPESTEIARVLLEEIRTDEGGRSTSLTLSGHKTTSSGIPKGVALDNVRTRSEYKGKRDVEIQMDGAIVPGDEAEMDGQIFTIGEITRYVNARRTQMKIKEA